MIINVTNPGVVNVADEAYAPILTARAALPRNLVALIPGDAFAPPIVPPGRSNTPVPTEVDVGVQSFLFPTSLGTPVDAPSDFFPQDQVDNELELYINDIIDADTSGPVTSNTQRYQITLSDTLTPFGIPFVGRPVTVVSDPFAPNVGQSRTIRVWSPLNGTVIVIDRSERGEDFGFLFRDIGNLKVGDLLNFNFDLDNQPTDYIVTGATGVAPVGNTVQVSGNFPTDSADEELVFETTIFNIVDADTGNAVGGGTTRYKITLADSLVPFGVTFIGKEVEVITDASASNVGQTRTIEYWSVNVIFVERSEGGQTFVNNLANGDVLSFPVDRQGNEVVSSQQGITDDVFLANETPDVFDLNGPGVIIGKDNFEGNFQAESGVVTPFVGSGVAAPRFLGTFEVESQTFGRGLPANVFVG